MMRLSNLNFIKNFPFSIIIIGMLTACPQAAAHAAGATRASSRWHDSAPRSSLRFAHYQVMQTITQR
ncbi:MAG TPA: hypothetical protein VHO48_00490 [Anaerolineaceae bacterium]|nr:hypothetical protein [Anaerolineaceae bacterium]